MAFDARTWCVGDPATECIGEENCVSGVVDGVLRVGELVVDAWDTTEVVEAIRWGGSVGRVVGLRTGLLALSREGRLEVHDIITGDIGPPHLLSHKNFSCFSRCPLDRMISKTRSQNPEAAMSMMFC
jgi:hypothetical protein